MDPRRGFLCALLLFLQLRSCTSFDTITPNQSITDGHVLVSRGESFALGFFRPGYSSRRYVGIWYNKVSEQTLVWVANRNNPLNDTSGVLSIDAAGNLIISSNSSATPLWSTNVSVAGTNNNASVVAKLLDTGNLVLIQQQTQQVLWQSFDYPTHTMMPFMKLGLDRKTGLNWFLTSWRSRDDPGNGSVSYRIDPSGVPQLFLYKGLTQLWRAGPWNGERWSGVPEMTNSFIFNVTYVDDQDEISVMYGIVNSSIFSRMVVDESGYVQRSTWHESDRRWVVFWSSPRDQCDYYGQCGAYSYCDPYNNADEFVCKCLPGFKPRSPRDWYLRDGTNGCVRTREDSVCRNGEGFVQVARAKLPDTAVARVDMSLGGEACKQECLRNCSCTAYSSADVRGGGSGCLTWHGDLKDIKVYPNEGQDIYIRVDAVELAAASSKSSKGSQGTKRTLVMVIVPIIFAVLLVVAIWYCFCRRPTKLGGHAGTRSCRKDFLEENEDLPFFNLSEIKSATDNFSNKLGEGGFGTVYKGRLSNGQEIAVKRLSKYSGQGVEEFKNEVLLIAKLQHRNLVKIFGCCIENEEKMLIYEYMPNKSLDSFIFDETRKALLDWKKRYEIIIGIARGILYLHQDSRLKIIHRDLKASNILLDGNLNSKISDFGMARIFGTNQTQANTKRVVGTFGYMSPEYALDGLFSMKSDVFSFGVLLLEIISGTKNLGLFNDNPLSNLIRHVWSLWREDRALEIVDSSMGVDSGHGLEALRCIQVGLLCVQENAMDRPTMSTVIFMLSNEVPLPSPKQPPFVVKKSLKIPDSTTSGSTSCSNNDMTITVINPR